MRRTYGMPSPQPPGRASACSHVLFMRKQLKRHAEIRVIAPQCDEKMQADTHLLCAAILSLPNELAGLVGKKALDTVERALGKQPAARFGLSQYHQRL